MALKLSFKVAVISSKLKRILPKLSNARIVHLMVVVSAAIFFVCSSIRHALFQSNAYDLGWYDQFAYFISQGQPPIVTFAHYHLLGDHVALIFYPIALFYKIYPDVHWLFAIQAIALAAGAWLVWRLALQSTIPEVQAVTLSAAYLLYPLVFNVNLYDFHPEVIAIPGIFAAVLAARQSRLGWFCFWVLLVLSCKVVLSLTVAAMGVWLLWGERRRWYGLLALAAGVCWFAIATQFFIPRYSGIEAAGVFRYAYLGNSVLEIVQNLFLKPYLLFGQVFTWGTLEYLIFLFLPVAWGMARPSLVFLLPALPTLAINILSESSAQRNLVQHYSVPLLPFLFLAMIATFAVQQAWMKNRRLILVWCCVCFLLFAKYGYFAGNYWEFLDNRREMQSAIAHINTQGSVLTTSQIAPHLTHRPNLQLAKADSAEIDLQQFDYVLLNQRHPGWASSRPVVSHLIGRLQRSPQFKLTYEQDDVFLFKRR